MTRIENTLFCDGCGMELTNAPVVQGESIYCCADCRDGYECTCGDRMELGEERRPETASLDAVQFAGFDY